MVDSPGIPLAFAAGVISFLSPCCLPLVPGYLAAVSGTARSESGTRLDRAVLARSLLFVATFSAIFVMLGLNATALGAFLFRNQSALNRVAGVAIVSMGILFIASVFIARLNADWRPEALARKAGRGGPVVAGAAFAVAWTPCIGPTLGAILGLAATQQSASEGALLLAVYSSGLAIPFLLSAAGFSALQQGFGFFKRHYAKVQVASGLLLVAMGVLVMTGELFRLNIAIRHLLDRSGLDVLNFLWQI